VKKVKRGGLVFWEPFCEKRGSLVPTGEAEKSAFERKEVSQVKGVWDDVYDHPS